MCGTTPAPRRRFRPRDSDTSPNTTYAFRTARVQKITWNADGTPDLRRPLAAGATQDLPSGDPGSTNYWINDSPTLPNGAHTLTVRVTGDKHPTSSNTVISLDRIEVY